MVFCFYCPRHIYLQTLFFFSFLHLQIKQELYPLDPFATPEALKKYPRLLAGDQVNEELALIKLGAPTN